MWAKESPYLTVAAFPSAASAHEMFEVRCSLSPGIAHGKPRLLPLTDGAVGSDSVVRVIVVGDSLGDFTRSALRLHRSAVNWQESHSVLFLKAFVYVVVP